MNLSCRSNFIFRTVGRMSTNFLQLLHPETNYCITVSRLSGLCSVQVKKHGLFLFFKVAASTKKQNSDFQKCIMLVFKLHITCAPIFHSFDSWRMEKKHNLLCFLFSQQFNFTAVPYKLATRLKRSFV